MPVQCSSLQQPSCPGSAVLWQAVMGTGQNLQQDGWNSASAAAGLIFMLAVLTS